MKDSLKMKLHNLSERHEEIAALLSTPHVITNQDQFRALSQEYAELEPIVACFKRYQKKLENIETAQQLLSDPDPDMRAMGQEELHSSEGEKKDIESQLQLLMLPSDPNDKRNVFLEIRAGTGGDEAAIFSGDLFRMYNRYAERQGWKVEVVSENLGEHGGFKEIICLISGQSVYSKLKFESGAHRVQRVPATESQGRIHTSACTVAIMPEVDDINAIEIDKNDLRIDTYRASGAGGQHVNKTDSAIRITHLPTGVVVECQEERSQHKNKAKAMVMLQSKLLSAAQSKQQAEQSEQRRNLVGSGDRSERIRTYNFPQGRVTDHRINLTLYRLPEIIEGDLDELLMALVNEHQADQLATMGL